MPLSKKFNGFRFKQFAIEHQHCAMKVGTDGIMLGSWIPSGSYTSVLDIGTGSGLIAIMLAQGCHAKCQIVGIDIDEKAVEQARHNAQNCPWPTKLHFHHQAVQELTSSEQYDLVVSNPPFFVGKSGELTPSDANFISDSRRKARHLNSLGFSELFQSVSNLLKEDGHFYCILPWPLNEVFNHAQRYGLFCDKQMIVKSTPSKPAKRQLLRFGFNPIKTDIEHLTIRTKEGSYSCEYVNLCRDYYLNF